MVDSEVALEAREGVAMEKVSSRETRISVLLWYNHYRLVLSYFCFPYRL